MKGLLKVNKANAGAIAGALGVIAGELLDMPMEASAGLAAVLSWLLVFLMPKNQK